MKTFLWAAAIVAVSPLIVAGCANQQPSKPAVSDTNPASRTYTREELDKTGRHQTGPALEAADPSVQASDGR